MNLYFFLSKAMPAWENVWNEKGGRLTISPPTTLFDQTFEKIVLLLAGSSLESATTDLLEEGTEEGLIIGVVASRRARGDRIELWLGGKVASTPAPSGWVEALKKVLNGELGESMETGKFKKHF